MAVTANGSNGFTPAPEDGLDDDSEPTEELPMLPWQKDLMIPLIEYRTTSNLLYYAAGTDEEEGAELRHWEAWKRLRVAISSLVDAARVDELEFLVDQSHPEYRNPHDAAYYLAVKRLAELREGTTK